MTSPRFLALFLIVGCGGVPKSDLTMSIDGDIPTRDGTVSGTIDGKWKNGTGDYDTAYVASNASDVDYWKTPGFETSPKLEGIEYVYVTVEKDGTGMALGSFPNSDTLVIQGNDDPNNQETGWTIAEIPGPKWTRIRYTGDIDSPIEMTVSDSGTWKHAGGSFDWELEMVMRSDCRKSGDPWKGFTTCAHGYVEDGTFPLAVSDNVNGCPAGLVDEIAPDPADYTRSGDEVSLGGPTFECLEDETLCGGEVTGLEADGCTWDVDVYANHGQASGNFFHIHGRGQGDCSDQLCTTALVEE